MTSSRLAVTSLYYMRGHAEGFLCHAEVVAKDRRSCEVTMQPSKRDIKARGLAFALYNRIVRANVEPDLFFKLEVSHDTYDLL